MEIEVKAINKSNITGVALLSKEEYEECMNIIPALDKSWWLRTPVENSFSDNTCAEHNYVGKRPVHFGIGIRPALMYDEKVHEIEVGDTVSIADYTWTVISGHKMLCNELVGYCPYRSDWMMEDANAYENSDALNYIINWWKVNSYYASTLNIYDIEWDNNEGNSNRLLPFEIKLPLPNMIDLTEIIDDESDYEYFTDKDINDIEESIKHALDVMIKEFLSEQYECQVSSYKYQII